MTVYIITFFLVEKVTRAENLISSSVFKITIIELEITIIELESFYDFRLWNFIFYICYFHFYIYYFYYFYIFIIIFINSTCLYYLNDNN